MKLLFLFILTAYCELLNDKECSSFTPDEFDDLLDEHENLAIEISDNCYRELSPLVKEHFQTVLILEPERLIKLSNSNIPVFMHVKESLSLRFAWYQVKNKPITSHFLQKVIVEPTEMESEHHKREREHELTRVAETTIAKLISKASKEVAHDILRDAGFNEEEVKAILKDVTNTERIEDDEEEDYKKDNFDLFKDEDSEYDGPINFFKVEE